jgi:hypothetical protein
MMDGFKVFSSLSVMLFILFGFAPVVFAQAVSEEAQRYFARGLAAVEMARSVSDFEAGAREREMARRAAPHGSDADYPIVLRGK